MHLYVKVVFQVFNTFQGPGPLPTPSSPLRRLITHCHKALFSSEGSGAPEPPRPTSTGWMLDKIPWQIMGEKNDLFRKTGEPDFGTKKTACFFALQWGLTDHEIAWSTVTFLDVVLLLTRNHFTSFFGGEGARCDSWLPDANENSWWIRTQKIWKIIAKDRPWTKN